jgi:hypothetical protein
MHSKASGISRFELLIILVFVIACLVFLLPKLFSFQQANKTQKIGEETAMIIYSAHKLCKTEARAENKECSTVNHIIQNINYEKLFFEKEFFTLLNGSKIEFSNNDTLEDGTSFAVTLPKKAGSFNVYITSNGDFSIGKSGNKVSGGKEVDATFNPLK